MASGVYQCADSQNTPIDDSLQDWDTLNENHDEPAVGAEGISASGISASDPDISAPPDTNLPVELQKIGLPSNNNVTPGHDHIELSLRKNQAMTHLNHLRELIADKSFQYSDLIRGAPRKAVVTRARATVKGINMRISFHCQVYTRCRSRLIYLGADASTLQQFCDLKKNDIKASTAILTPNEPGSTTLELPWIWHDVARHILPKADATLCDNPGNVLECISSHHSPTVFQLIMFQSGVFIGFVPEHRCTVGMRSVPW